MKKVKFTACEREAIWLAHSRRCAYTQEPLDFRDLQIDHIIPEYLVEDPIGYAAIAKELSLPDQFNIRGYENLLPCRAPANYQKGKLLFPEQQLRYFLSIAVAKLPSVEKHLAKVKARDLRGKALILLQQCIERNELSIAEVAKILEQYSDRPTEIFSLLESLHFSGTEEIRHIAKSEIGSLRSMIIRPADMTAEDDVVLTNDEDEVITVCTCLEYERALTQGYYALSNLDMKKASFIQQRCDLLNALETATTPKSSFISDPRIGVTDLHLLPFSMFPYFEEEQRNRSTLETYQSKVDDGTLVVKEIRQNLVHVCEPEGMGHHLMEVARADFRGDGTESILVFESIYATHGSFGAGYTRILTRRSSSEMLQATVIEATTSV